LTAQPRHSQHRDPLATILDDLPLRAGGFIVTLYGDVVAPRGGEVWIGNIIETCAAVGISETLVRTAVSRLVASGQLTGRRAGRRGFYRLAPEAEAEYAAAADAIYGRPAPCGWRFTVLPESGAEAQMAALERAGHTRLRTQVAFGPDRDQPPLGALVFPSTPQGATALLPAFVAAAYDLQTHARAYAVFLARFTPLLPAAPELDGSRALTARLLLVHAYRAVLLRDPRLPAEALPADWPGHAARTHFARTYLALSPAADRHLAQTFAATSSALPAHTTATKARLARLADAAAEPGGGPHLAIAQEALHE